MPHSRNPMIRVLRTSISALVVFLLSAAPAFAQSSSNCQQEQDSGILQNPLNACSLIELLEAVLAGVVRIGALFLVLAFVWIGFQFAAAQGNDEKLSKARSALMWTVIGAAILLGAEVIKDLIVGTVSSVTPQ